MSAPLVILKQSATEVLVWKSAGVASELPAGLGEDSIQSLLARQIAGSDPKLPHRLDRVTRGLLLVCLTPEAIAFHNAQIQARRWEKYYLARVVAPAGRAPASVLGEHKAFLVEKGGRAERVRAGGKPSRLEILAAAEVPGNRARWQLVIRLMTGRFHQIRVMCEGLGIPVAGDPLYDSGAHDASEFYLEHIILKYVDFDTRAPSTVFRRECAERGALAPEISQLLELVATREMTTPC